MAKESMKNREAKRAKLVQRFAAKRAALKAIIQDPNAEPEAKWDAQLQLQKMRMTQVLVLCISSLLSFYDAFARLLRKSAMASEMAEIVSSSALSLFPPLITITPSLLSTVGVVPPPELTPSKAISTG